MNKGMFIEYLTQRPELFHSILQFNGALNPSPLPQAFMVPGFKPEALKNYPSRTTDLGYWDFDSEPSRLALLTDEEIKQLALTFGTALHADTISLVIDKSEYHTLHDSLGKTMYSYAISRGRFQIGNIRTLFAERDKDLSLYKRIILHGKQSLSLVAQTWPEQLKKRRSDIFECGNRPLPTLSSHEQFALWLCIKKIFLKEVAPQWAPCFN